MIQTSRSIGRAALGAVLLFLPWTLSAGAVGIVNDIPLSFGTLISGPTSGTATVTSAGVTTTTGGVIAFGGGSAPASFTITIAQGNPNYTILIPASTILTGPGGTMVVDTFESTPGGRGHVRPPTGFQTMTVGATLHIGANQAPGTYSGTFDITVTAP